MTAPLNHLRTAYLGPQASFSHQAALEALPHTRPEPLPSFGKIFSALQGSGSASSSGEIYDYGILPIENSTNGSVVQALDLLARCGTDSTFPDIEVVDEHYLEVHHWLYVSRSWAEHRLTEEEIASLDAALEAGPNKQELGSLLAKLDIKTVYTHPQVWGQCNAILSSLLPPGQVDRVDMSSTSAAAEFVLRHPSGVQGDGIAAIASPVIRTKYQQELVCIAMNIEDAPGTNTTRFLILRNRTSPQTVPALGDASSTASPVKSLFTFAIAHSVPGSLAKALAVFAQYGFNLSAIQSRPKPKDKTRDNPNNEDPGYNTELANWKYVFFVECLHPRYDGDSMQSSQGVIDLSRDLRAVTEQLSFMGSWHDRLGLETA